MKSVIHWGIIGCGDVCEIKSGPAFNKVEHSKLVAVMRRDLNKAQDYAARHNVQYYYNDASKLIAHPGINAIYIATPPSSHELYAELALKAGKFVYVEKPVSIDAASCNRMIALAEKYSGKVSVAHYRRALPLFREVKRMIEDGTIGKVRTIDIKVLKEPKENEDHWRTNPEIAGGGYFNDLSPHQLDILYWIFGYPKNVSGHSLNQGKRYIAPDVVSLRAEFDGEILFHGLWSFNTPAYAATEECEITGELGKLRFSFFSNTGLELTNADGMRKFEMHYPTHIQQPMIDAVARYFRDEGPNPCSLDDAMVVMRMIDAANSPD